MRDDPTKYTANRQITYITLIGFALININLQDANFGPSNNENRKVMKAKSTSYIESLSDEMQQLIIRASKSTLIIGICTILIGIVAVLHPTVAGQISTISIGIIITLSGTLRFGFALFSYSIGSMIMRYLFAIVMIVAGVWIVSNPDMGMQALSMFMAIYFIADGITSMAYALTLSIMKGSRYLIAGGVISILFGILIIAHWPDSSNVVLGSYLGIKLIIDGLAFTLTSNLLRKSGSLIEGIEEQNGI